MHTETVLESNDIDTVVAARAGDTLGYARVSTNDQNLDAQRARLTEAGAIRVFTDIVSGKRFERPGLAELIDHARPGDRLCVSRLDRLGRSLKELLETVDGLKAHGIHLVSLEERLDTSSAAGELVFHVFGSIAHFERRLISERTRDGIAAARKRGRTPGRPPLDPETVSAAQKLIEAGLSPGQAAKQLGIGRATAYRIAKTMRGLKSESRCFGALEVNYGLKLRIKSGIADVKYVVSMTPHVCPLECRPLQYLQIAQNRREGKREVIATLRLVTASGAISRCGSVCRPSWCRTSRAHDAPTPTRSAALIFERLGVMAARR